MLFAALIRHANYEQPPGVPSAHLLHPLTGDGERQARDLAGQLLELASEHGSGLADVVDTSPLLRAWQTAQIVATTLSSLGQPSLRLSQCSALCERSLGAAANLTIEQVRAQLERDPRCTSLPADWKTATDYALPVPGAESLRAAGFRVAQHLQASMRQLADTTRAPTLKLFVGHGAAFRYGAYALGVLPLTEVPRLSMHHCRPVVLRYTPDGAFEHVSGHWKTRAAGALEQPLD
jgi:broad specificity phosphatase PhoE